MNRQVRRLAAGLAVSTALSIAGAAHADSSPFPPSARWQPPTSKDYVSDGERKRLWRSNENALPKPFVGPTVSSSGPASAFSPFPASARWQPPTSTNYSSDYERSLRWSSGSGTSYSSATSCGALRTGAMPSGGFPLILLPIILPVVVVAAAASAVNSELCATH